MVSLTQMQGSGFIRHPDQFLHSTMSFLLNTSATELSLLNSTEMCCSTVMQSASQSTLVCWFAHLTLLALQVSKMMDIQRHLSWPTCIRCMGQNTLNMRHNPLQDCQRTTVFTKTYQLNGLFPIHWCVSSVMPSVGNVTLSK